MEACMAAVLFGVMRLLGCPFDGAWSVSCAYWRSFVFIVCVPCLLCFLAVPGVWSILRVTRQVSLIQRISQSVEQRRTCFPYCSDFLLLEGVDSPKS